MHPYRDALLEAVEAHQILIIVAETGAGKTTQVRSARQHGGAGDYVVRPGPRRGLCCLGVLPRSRG